MLKVANIGHGYSFHEGEAYAGPPKLGLVGELFMVVGFKAPFTDTATPGMLF